MEFNDDELNVLIDAIERYRRCQNDPELEDLLPIVESVDRKLREELRQRLADQAQELNMGYE